MSALFSGFHHLGAYVGSGQAHSCGCVGPQNGNPVCPCLMPEYNRRKMADMAMEILRRQTAKPRIRVKAGRQEHAT